MFFDDTAYDYLIFKETIWLEIFCFMAYNYFSSVFSFYFHVFFL